MSGFQIKTWWACSTEPQTAHSAIQTGRYGRGSLAIIPSKQDSIASDAIVVGGLDGHLRIYRPSDSTLTPKHLRLQTHLQAPIIQIAVGKFSSQDGVSVALLFPASLAIFKFIDESSSLQRLYDLKLPAPSANFVHGKFKGLSNGQEQCCVQTQNGSMVIVDDGRIAAEASFGNFLVPGPIVEQILSSAESSKAMQPVWRALIGENITHVDCITTQFEVEIVVIGQQHIFTLTESGELKRQMIIEVETACCGKAFTSKGDTFITCSTTGIFKLFQNFQLEWAAQAEFVPVSIVIGEFCGIPGFIVSIDASGYLIAAYLGTEIRPFKRLSERRSTERLDLSRSGSQTQPRSSNDSLKIFECEFAWTGTQVDICVKKRNGPAVKGLYMMVESSGSLLQDSEYELIHANEWKNEFEKTVSIAILNPRSTFTTSSIEIYLVCDVKGSSQKLGQSYTGRVPPHFFGKFDGPSVSPKKAPCMLTIKVHPSLSLSTFISGLKRGTFSYWSGAQLFLREENDLIFIHSTSINDLWMVLEELDELSAAWSERLGCCLVLHSCPNPDTLLDGVKILFKLSKAVQASKEELQALGRLYIKCVLQLDALPSPWSKKVQFLVNTLFQKVKNGEEEYRAHLDNMDSSLPHFNAYLKVLCWMLRVHSKISCVSPAFNSSRNLHDEYCDWLRQMTSLLKYSLPFNVLSSSQSDKTLSDFCILFSRFLTEGTGDLTFIK